MFRFPRRQVAVDLLTVEQNVLPAIAPRLPRPVPVLTMAGQPDDHFPWPFAEYRMLPGRTACVAALSPSQRMKAAEPIARFLAALHAIPAAQAARLGAGPDSIDRLDLSKRVPRTRENLERVVQLGLIDGCSPWIAMLDELDLARRAKSTTLVHGDLYARHMLVDDDGRPCGVIDWGDVHIGDPAIDLSSDHVLNIAYNILCGGMCLENIRLRQSRHAGNLLHEGPNRCLTGSSKCLGFCETNHIQLRQPGINGTTICADGPGRPSAGLPISPKQQ